MSICIESPNYLPTLTYMKIAIEKNAEREEYNLLTCKKIHVGVKRTSSSLVASAA